MTTCPALSCAAARPLCSWAAASLRRSATAGDSSTAQPAFPAPASSSNQWRVGGTSSTQTEPKCASCRCCSALALAASSRCSSRAVGRRVGAAAVGAAGAATPHGPRTPGLPPALEGAAAVEVIEAVEAAELLRQEGEEAAPVRPAEVAGLRGSGDSPATLALWLWLASSARCSCCCRRASYARRLSRAELGLCW